MVTSSLTIDEIDEAKEREDLKTLEAVFFVSGRFLNIQELISLSDLNPIVIKDLIEKLKEKYDSENSSLEIVEKNGLWKMDVKPDYEHLVNKLATGSSEFTKAEQETLAIIAFKQPIKQSVIVKIRGNKAYDHIKKFASIGLIKKKKMGHTHELSLSDDFYDYFNISEEERSNVPEMNAKIKQQIENAEQEVDEEEKQGKVEESGRGSVEDVIERIEDEKSSEKLDNVNGIQDKYEEIKEQIGADSDKFQEPAKGYVEEVESETTEEIIKETAPKNFKKVKNENPDAAEDLVEDVVEEVEEKEKIEKEVMDDLKKIS